MDSNQAEQTSPARFFTSSGPTILQSTQRGKRKEELESMMIKSLLAAMAVSAALAVSAFSAQIGDSVSAELTSKFVLQNNSVTAIQHVNLDKGVWQLNGQIVIVEPHNGGFAVVGGTMNTISDLGPSGTVLFDSKATLTNTFFGLSLAGRTIEIEADNTPVFLLAFSQSVPNVNGPSFAVRGFITAIKIRNLSGP
jgi:hypothetical protein